MTFGLLASIAALAALDALNPATIAGVALILLLPGEGQVRIATGFVAGAMGIIVAAGVALYLGLSEGAARGALSLDLVRPVLLSVAAVILAVVGLRRLRPRHRAAVKLPTWLTPGTAAGLGVLVTAADLPNAFPYVIAIDLLVTEQITTWVAISVLVAYSFVYCLPCILLLLVGARGGARVRRRLARLYDRFGAAADLPANPWMTLLYLLGSTALLWFAFT